MIAVNSIKSYSIKNVLYSIAVVCSRSFIVPCTAFRANDKSFPFGQGTTGKENPVTETHLFTSSFHIFFNLEINPIAT
jgi:hypothetical protein